MICSDFFNKRWLKVCLILICKFYLFLFAYHTFVRFNVLLSADYLRKKMCVCIYLLYSLPGDTDRQDSQFANMCQELNV